jgi:hypothetical protein
MESSTLQFLGHTKSVKILLHHDTQPASVFELANQAIVTCSIDTTKQKVNNIMRDNLPLGIIDDVIPPDIYHYTLNPNPSMDKQAYTEKKKEEKETEQDSGKTMDIDSLDKLEKIYYISYIIKVI